jgi:hypothetical protein
MYQMRAVSTIMNSPQAKELSWLFDKDKAEAAGAEKSVWKRHHCILAELGKIEDEEEFFATARIACKRKLAGHAGAVVLRRMRLGEGAYSSKQLTTEIIKTVDSYLRRFPSMPLSAVRTALIKARGVI